jgi:[ribosomal protein S5]-alanine N-acetyltransferase
MKFLLDRAETERLHFRKIDQSDFAVWLGFFKDPSSFQHWVSEKMSPEVECENWYKKQFNRYENDLGGMNALVEKPSGKLIGHAGLLIQQVDGIAELEIAYSLLPEGRNKGYATEAARKTMDVAFQNNYAPSLISIISATNFPSMNVATKNSMKAEKQTIYHQNHVTIFRITKEEWKKNR